MKDAIQYTVTVTAKIERRQTVSSYWAKVGQKPSPYDADKLVDEMGYTPETETLVSKDIEVFKQTVDTLDMAQLVKVVNQIEPVDNHVGVRVANVTTDRAAREAGARMAHSLKSAARKRA